MHQNKPLITPLQTDAGAIPSIMPSPFSDIPHPLAQQACLILQQRLCHDHIGSRDFFACDGGKMFGVLVVKDKFDCIGFLSAFSGMINGIWNLDGFVPPIFNQAEQNQFLPAGKAELNQQAALLKALETAPIRNQIRQQAAHLQQQRTEALSALKQQHKKAKDLRKTKRLKLQENRLAPEYQVQMSALALASQHHKRELTNAKNDWAAQLDPLKQQFDQLNQDIHDIKASCSDKSRLLHDKVFASYVLSNALNEQQCISHFFADSTPPAGSGDCAGPKLLHYAQQQQLQPLALSEFWWGASPSTGVRHHKQFYPACRGKCRPILPFMLRGLNVDPEPYYGQEVAAHEPQIIYEDDQLLVINKPAGLLSVPGKEIKDCVFNRLLKRYPHCTELRLVHRLDMSTSGLLLVAKSLAINKLLQKQFIQRSVEKRYEALLSKELPLDLVEGDINLPLRVDFDDRPRQMVCYQHGKAAKTHWQLIKHENNRSRVHFYPLTGRTHQLRVHAAHKDGLNAAIVGDDLYGLAGGRLMLHAQRLCFNHPISRERLEFEAPTPF
ncbi:MAG: pseudouridine synthase [Mariprofundaceae bacterium]